MDVKQASETVKKTRERLVGLAAAGAVASGWTDDEAAIIGLTAGESASGRVATGETAERALGNGIGDAEAVMLLNRFSQELDRTGDAKQAFEAAIGIKVKATEGAPGAEAAYKAAEQNFAEMLRRGLAPHAAFLSAFIAAATTARLADQSAG